MIRLFRHSIVKSHSRIEQQRQIGGIRPGSVTLMCALHERPAAECEKRRGGK
jgi:hypothetical protein